MDLFTTFFNAALPHFTQLSFWITVAVTLAVWYLLSVFFAHLLAGAGGRDPVAAARLAMPLALVLMLVGLGSSEYFLFNPLNLPYLVAVSVASFLLTVMLLAVFSRLGKDN